MDTATETTAGEPIREHSAAYNNWLAASDATEAAVTAANTLSRKSVRVVACQDEDV